MYESFERARVQLMATAALSETKPERIMSKKHCDNMSRCDVTNLADSGLDADERAILLVMRHYFQSFTQPQSQGWIMAFRAALQHFPHDHAANVALVTLSVVQAMRMSRCEAFRFSNPDCVNCSQLLCEDERQLIGVVAATRRGQRSRTHTHALLICEGNETVSLLNAARELSHLLVAAQPARAGQSSFVN